MKQLLTIVLLFLINIFISSAQDSLSTNDYKTDYLPVKASGKIPDDLCKLFTEEYISEKNNINSDKTNRKERNAKDCFLQESNYYINQIMMSGIVLYNTPFNEYLNKILDRILINEPEIRNNIRVYVLKTASVNAFATDKGILFVNLGLLAQSSSESQLAYVISHELIHYVKKHNIELFLEKDKLVRKNSTFVRSSSSKEILYKTHFRSREMENEADERGFNDYFLKTNYDLNQAIETYDVLQYAYLPFDEIAFDKSFLTDSMFFFPDNYFPESINPIKARDDFDDENSTHPNIKKRRELLYERLEKQNNANRIINPLGDEYFKAIRDMARFECLRLYVINQNFTQSFYNAWLMKKEYPQNLFLDRIISASLYSLSKYKTNDNSNSVIPNLKKSEGEIHAVNSLFKNIKRNELNALALRYIFKTSLIMPEDKYITDLKNDLFHDLVFKQKANIKDFENFPQRFSKVEITEEKTDSLQKQSSKIRNIEKKKKNQKNIEFYNYIFVGLIDNETFISDFKKTVKEAEDYLANKKRTQDKKNDINNQKKEVDKDDLDSEIIEEDEDEIINSGFYQRRGFKLGIDKILTYNPFYIKIDFRKSQNLRFFDTEKSQLEYYDLLKENAQKVGLKMDMITTSDFKTQGTELYNKHLLLNEWTDEFSNWDTKGKKIMFLSQEIKSIIDEYHTSYLNLTGIASAKATNVDNQTFSMLLYSAISPVLWPFTLQHFFRPAFQTVYYNLLVDMETGKKYL